MFVPLATAYEPLLAQKAAGVLRSHGIAAWVAAGGSSGGSDTVAAGDCLVMVREGEAGQAALILDANLSSAGTDGAHTMGRPLSLFKSAGVGIIQGAVWLPLLSLVFYCVIQLLAALHWAPGPMLGHLGTLSRALSDGILSLILTGAAIGLVAGFGACLLSNYRHSRKTGIVFIGFIVLLVLLPELLRLLLQ